MTLTSGQCMTVVEHLITCSVVLLIGNCIRSFIVNEHSSMKKKENVFGAG